MATSEFNVICSENGLNLNMVRKMEASQNPGNAHLAFSANYWD